MYRLDAELRELRDLVSRGPWAVGIPSAARALLPGPRGSLNRGSSQGNASNHLRLQRRCYQRITTHAALRMDGLLGSQIMELFAEDELEVDRLFAAASSQFEQAYNTSKASRRRSSLTRK